MKRLILVSNRAPVSLTEKDGELQFRPSSGGLVSGLGAWVERMKKTDPALELIWVGWPGTDVPDRERVRAAVRKRYNVQCVFLTEAEMADFYDGFCNNTIWPLFHYFPLYTVYDKVYWEAYRRVNQRFAEAVLKLVRPGDVIWIQDYHLMLLPAMIRSRVPDAWIGFFLHIPFPAYEVFRLLPSEWRKEILEGLFGADLIGFHTFGYRTYFLHSALNILGLTDQLGEVIYNNRLVKVDSFPMGIDYQKYHLAARAEPGAGVRLEAVRSAGVRLILSIDRQDYSKGILNRLKAYQHFLENNPGWRGRATLMLVVVPSRIGVESYQSIKSQIDELVGHINGAFGSLEWTPINYQYRSLAFDELIALYNGCDVALITPLRDGMNLIAKEFIASRTRRTGVLVLSEMTGAALELLEAIIINPNNIEEISAAMRQALEMGEAEQARRLIPMQHRVKSYDVFKWVHDYVSGLESIKKKQERLAANMMSSRDRDKVLRAFRKASVRTLFLDYDGTLVEHIDQPDAAIPDNPLLHLLRKLSQIPGTSVIIISGRGKATLEKWFGRFRIGLVAEHGVFYREAGTTWKLLKPVRKQWKKKVLPVLKEFAEKLPGAFVEEKEYAVVFHYRKSEPAFASLRVMELMNHLMSLISNMDLQLVNGNKVLEIRNAGIDKGVAALHWLGKQDQGPHCIVAAGNDQTDEDLFRSLPSDAYTIRVGNEPTYARFNLSDATAVRDFLAQFVA